MNRAAIALRWIALAGTLLGIATLEYLAGDAAGWGAARSGAVPVALDAFVMSVLLAPRARWYDRAAALLLMEATVVISAVAGHHGKGDNTALGAVLATALVFALWRVDETFRADKEHADELADAVACMGRAEAVAGDLREEAARIKADAASVRRRLEDERAAHAAEVARLKADRQETPDPGQDGKRGTIPDGELEAIICDVLTDPKAGYGKVTAAIEDAGWAVGRTDRIKAAIAAHKRQGLHAVPTSAVL